ncbi:hypothetical protein LSH36_172g03001 [Paralvinella palmiformis]|uniref:Peroxisomal membrane protein PEX14 n=1 Tax=Paralvinella palmiformis TaxID=53620 RepID=A0AAD9JTN6_9ANNE|nr:hypothetical protein LSH36_172g03001 [Paralvinella palmiformis]
MLQSESATSDKTMDSETATLRENMIATAVRFLQNPKVTQSPLSQKKSFLEKKGLTPEEIDIAVQKAGVVDIIPPSPGVIPTQAGLYTPNIQAVPQTTVSTWTKIKDYTSSAAIIGGFAYLIYKIYKQYIMPYWFGPSQEERQLAAIQQSITELQSSVIDTLKFIKDVQNSITVQQVKIDALSSESTTVQRSTNDEGEFVREVKDEIKSLKGLLLSRKQFPPAPPPQPVLPAWQLVAPNPDETVAGSVSSVESGTVTQEDTSVKTTTVTQEVSHTESATTPPAISAESFIFTPEDLRDVKETAKEYLDNGPEWQTEDAVVVTNGQLPNGSNDKDVEGDEEEFTSLKSTHKALPKEAESQMGQTHETTEVS